MARVRFWNSVDVSGMGLPSKASPGDFLLKAIRQKKRKIDRWMEWYIYNILHTQSIYIYIHTYIRVIHPSIPSMQVEFHLLFELVPLWQNLGEWCVLDSGSCLNYIKMTLVSGWWVFFINLSDYPNNKWEHHGIYTFLSRWVMVIYHDLSQS